MANETILIVDDGKDNRDFLVDYVLKPNGYRSLQANDGLKGLELAINHKPDLILLDYNMPRMDGGEVLKQLRERGINIPVIMMTLYGSEELAVEVHRLGVRDYIKKPYYPEEMLAAIEKSLEETRTEREKNALHDRVVQTNREMKKLISELNILYGIGKSVTSMNDMRKLLPHIVDAALQLTHAQEGYLIMVEGDGMVCRVQKRHDAQHPETVNMPTRDPIAARAIKTGQPMLIDPRRASTMNFNGKMPRPAAYAPLIYNKRTFGVLGVRNVASSGRHFTGHDTALLSALSDYAAIAIENARNLDALRQAKDQEKATIRDAFERLVPPSVVDQALTQPDSLRLGGNRRVISVLFVDISGYSTWSENADPEDVIETLNHYFSLAAEVILGWEGTLDKFLGDGFMAIFNAPEDQTDHVFRAADVALALIKAAGEVQSMHGHRLTYSIGLHVGEAVVGYIGADRAMNYTAIGDTVNLAKRLQESAAPGQILIDESVLEHIGDHADTKGIGEIKVKGRIRPTLAYELTGLRYEIDNEE